MSFVWFILIGLLSGYIAGRIMRGGGFGIWVNLLVGVVGGVLGGWLLGIVGLHSTGLIGSLCTSVLGAVVLLWLVGYLAGK